MSGIKGLFSKKTLNDVVVHTISNIEPHDHNDIRKLVLQTPQVK
jgi:hypothetical protein